MDTSKIKEVLDKFLQTNVTLDFHITSIFLEEIRKTGETTDLTKNTTIYIQWITVALKQWQDHIPRLEIANFTIELCSILCQHELKFLLLNKINAFELLSSFIRKEHLWTYDCVNIEYVKLLYSCHLSKSGVEWLIANCLIWNFIFDLNLIESNELYRKEFIKFQVDFSLKIACINRLFVISSIQKCVSPILKMSNAVTADSLGEKSEGIWYREVCPALTLITDKYEYIVEVLQADKNFNLLLKYNRIFNLDERLYKILNVVTCERLILKVTMILLPINILEITRLLSDQTDHTSQELLENYTEKIIDLFKINIVRGYTKNVFELCYKGSLYRSKKYNSVSYSINNFKKTFVFETQFLLLNIAPIIFINLKVVGKNIQTVVDMDENRDDYVQKLFDVSHPSVVRLVYQWRDLQHKRKNLVDLAILSIEYILKCIPLYSKECGLIIFQTFIYFVDDLFSNLTNEELWQNHIIILSMDCLISCIVTYDISWKDSLESLRVLDVSASYLNLPNLPGEIVTRSLKLVELSISKCLSSNLVLLLETKDSTMNFIGPLLHSKVLDENLEVKKAGLEVLLTISEKAKSKFPYFQKILIDYELPTFAVNVALSKSNIKLRELAINCLKHMTMMENIWTQSINLETFQIKLIDVLKTEKENGIRAAIIELLTCIYIQEYFTDSFEEKLYHVMFSLNIQEPSKCVKMAALKFWKNVMDRHLCQEGMIDNTFPEIIFSKKLRKIIVLDDQNIKVVLRKYLEKLSTIGCLGVLFYNIFVDEQSELTTDTLLIVEELIILLRKYHLETEYGIQYHGISKVNVEDLQQNIDILKIDILENKRISPRDFFFSFKHIDRSNSNNSDLSCSNNESCLNSILAQLVDNMNIN